MFDLRKSALDSLKKPLAGIQVIDVKQSVGAGGKLVVCRPGERQNAVKAVLTAG
jgi:hypothetical protein